MSLTFTKLLAITALLCICHHAEARSHPRYVYADEEAAGGGILNAQQKTEESANNQALENKNDGNLDNKLEQLGNPENTDMNFPEPAAPAELSAEDEARARRRVQPGRYRRRQTGTRRRSPPRRFRISRRRGGRGGNRRRMNRRRG